MSPHKVQVKIIRPTTGPMPYFKVSCPCCPRFLETHQRHAVALYVAWLHAVEEHPKLTHGFYPYAWDVTRCGQISGGNMCGYGRECHTVDWLDKLFQDIRTTNTFSNGGIIMGEPEFTVVGEGNNVVVTATQKLVNGPWPTP